MVLTFGCASSHEAAEREVLLSHPAWPKIQSLVRAEIIRREGPLNTLGRQIEIELSGNGEILSYVRRWEIQR